MAGVVDLSRVFAVNLRSGGNISLGKLRPTTLPTIPIHNIIYSTGLTSPLIPPKMFCIASAELQGCTQKHGMSVNG